MFAINDIHLFAFPINLIIGISLLFLSTLTVLGKSYKKRLIFSPYTTLITMALMVIICFAIGILPKSTIIRITASYPFAIFVLWVLFLLSAHIVFRIKAILIARQIVWRDLMLMLCHTGMWLLLLSTYLGSTDKYNTTLIVDRDNYSLKPLHIKLDSFQIEQYPSGEPSSFIANLILMENGVQENATISVNHPHHFRGYDIYLSGYDTDSGERSQYAVLLISKEPWKDCTRASIIVVLLGTLVMLFKRERR